MPKRGQVSGSNSSSSSGGGVCVCVCVCVCVRARAWCDFLRCAETLDESRNNALYVDALSCQPARA
jgi:hypothetical protein